MVIREKIKRLSFGIATGDDGRANGAGIIAQMRGAGGGDAGKDAGGHYLIALLESVNSLACQRHLGHCLFSPRPLTRARKNDVRLSSR